MHGGVKILIGVGATALLAAALHWPFGQGAAFVTTLQHGAEIALAQRGLSDVHVSFSDGRFLTRTAQLTGRSAGLVQRSDAFELLHHVRGVAGSKWVERAVPPPLAAAPGGQAKPASEPAPAAAPPPPPVASPTATPTPTPVAAAPAPVTAAAGGKCQSLVDGAVNRRVMSFRSGSAWLNADSRKLIADVAAALKQCQGYRLAIGGHTDNHGSELVNTTMSQERANRVRDALVELGVPATAVSARGYGSSQPISPGNAADPANRRITFTVSGGGA